MLSLDYPYIPLQPITLFEGSFPQNDTEREREGEREKEKIEKEIERAS